MQRQAGIILLCLVFRKELLNILEIPSFLWMLRFAEPIVRALVMVAMNKRSPHEQTEWREIRQEDDECQQDQRDDGSVFHHG